ncbi:MAG: class I SAM-dependent methyltransferase [Actinoallomurus sp.]
MNAPVFDRAEDAERYEVVSGGYDAALFAAAAISPQDRVLDIGCGYGATTRQAARLASAGHALGDDLVEPVLRQSRAFAAAEGITNITFEPGDAQTHPFPTGAFDVAISRFGVMFFADPVAAFANICRALRPGGRLVFATVGRSQDNDLPGVIASIMRNRPDPDPAGTRTVHSLADPDHIHDLLTRAGFREVGVSSVETTVEPRPDAAAAADFILGWGAFRGTVDETDPEAIADARAALTDAARPFETPEGVRLRGTAWLVTATAPPHA